VTRKPLSAGLIRALQTLQANDPEPVRTGRETTPYQVATSAAWALKKRGLAVVNAVERIRIDYEVELTDEGQALMEAQAIVDETKAATHARHQ
jgi:hypothetical protein